jgi:uncharacterized protein YacL
MITLHLRRGEKILYRSGPRVAGQFVLINNGEEEAASFSPQSHVLGKILDTSVIIDGRI